MALLVNVMGAPCSGKSTLISMFKKNYPGRCACFLIDEIRVRVAARLNPMEYDVWEELRRKVLAELSRLGVKRDDAIIIESSGLSTKLPSIVWAAILEGHCVQNIHLIGLSEDFKERLRQRIQSPNYKPIPFEYPTLSMEDLIDKCANKLEQLWSDSTFIYTDNKYEIDKSYKKFEEVILERLRMFCK